MRNSQIEKSLNKKMHARYIGPLIAVSRNYGGAYILAELDGTVLHRPIAAFRLLPYFTRKSIPLPPDFIDIDDTRLHEMEHSLVADGDEDSHGDRGYWGPKTARRQELAPNYAMKE
jgi:hypothetical protein